MIALLLACAGPPPVDSACEEPSVDYDSFGEGFLLTHCQGCHASTSPDRFGAPIGVSFDDEAQARTWSAQIHEAVLESGVMPPGGGIPAEDRVLLDRWLRCL